MMSSGRRHARRSRGNTTLGNHWFTKRVLVWIWNHHRMQKSKNRIT